MKNENRQAWCGSAATVAAALVGVLASGCGKDASAPPSVRHVITRGPVQPAAAPVIPLPTSAASVDPSPLALIAAPVAGTVVDARVLVISADGSEAELAAIRQTLDYLGTPYDVLVATQTTLTAGFLASGMHGKYNAVILTRGNLALSNGSSAFTAGEFQTLATYEATFQVRRVSLYTFPDASYGYSGADSQDTSSNPLVASCTTAGRTAFPYVNCSSGVTISGAFAYLGTPADGSTVPLFTDSAGRALAATRNYGDGREAMSLNFSQAPSLFHSLQLLRGAVSWATRGVFVGQHHTYIGVQIDDLFLADDIYTGGTFRMSASDLQAALDYQNNKRGQAVTAGFRYNMAFNGGGTVQYAPDALATKAQQIGSGFNWISHTYDHATLDPLAYADVVSELTKNAAISDQYGLKPFTIASLVPPSYSGLTSSTSMQAMFDTGVRYVVGDTSVSGYDNPTPNAGIYNPLQPAILMIPRRPANLFYNVSTPDQWLAEYNDIYRSFWGRDLTYDEIIDHESDVLAQYLLKGENDPWMFHQPDLHIYSSGRSMLGDLLDQTFTKYASRVTTPLVGPTMDVLGTLVAKRMQFNAAGVSATIDPNAKTITVFASHAATVPVTGACGGSTEAYAGQAISTVALSAGASATLAFANGASCSGSGGGAGNPGTGGSPGTGGNPGTGGTGGGSAFSLPCSALSVVAGQIGAGQSAAALTTAELSGMSDVWDDYVELSPSSRVVCNYALPAGVSAASVTSLSLDVNYRGPSKNTMTWTFEVLDTTTGNWTSLGDNSFASGWVWTAHTFALPAPASRFFASGTLQIRYGTTSNADASDIDQLLIRGTVGSSGTGGSPGTGGTRGTGGSPGSGGNSGTGGGTGMALSLPCSSLAVQTGEIGAGQVAAALTTAELTGTTDVWTDYVELSPASRIVCNYVLPAGVSASALKSLAVQVNYRGPTVASQLWKFEVLDTTTGAWTALGDNTFADDWSWTGHTFTMPAPLTRFFSGATLQLRYGTTSSTDSSDLDQLLVVGGT